MSFLGRTQKDKVAVVVDVESGSAAVAIVALGARGPARVILSERAYLPLEERAPEHTGVAIVTLLSELTGRVTKKYAASDATKRHHAVSSVHVMVGAPWVHSRTAHAEEGFTQERVITDAMIKDLAKRALQEPSGLEQSRIFETSITRVQLNGYPTAKPVGKYAHTLSVTAFQSDIDSFVKHGIENALHQHFPGRTIDFRSSTRAALSMLHDRSPRHHYMLLVIGATNTDFIAAHKEDANEHASIPIGISTIAQRLAGDFGLPDEVFSLMRMLASDACNTPACEKMKANLARFEPELVRIFGDVFAMVAMRRKIPNACFVLTHVDFVPWLEHFLARIDFAQFTVTAQPLAIESLTPEHVRSDVAWEAGVREDSGIALGAWFVNNVLRM